MDCTQTLSKEIRAHQRDRETPGSFYLANIPRSGVVPDAADPVRVVSRIDTTVKHTPFVIHLVWLPALCLWTGYHLKVTPASGPLKLISPIAEPEGMS